MRVFTVLLALAAMLPACSSEFGRDEAIVECDADRAMYPNCVDQASYDACIVCHEECGTDCATLGAVCPTTFTCPEDP